MTGRHITGPQRERIAWWWQNATDERSCAAVARALGFAPQTVRRVLAAEGLRSPDAAYRRSGGTSQRGSQGPSRAEFEGCSTALRTERYAKAGGVTESVTVLARHSPRPTQLAFGW